MSILESFNASTILLIVLAAVAIKVSILAAAVWVVAKFARVESATTKHQLAKFVLWGMLLMPLLVFLVPSVSLPEMAWRLANEPVVKTSPREPAPTVASSTNNLDSTEFIKTNELASTSLAPSPTQLSVEPRIEPVNSTSYFSPTQFSAMQILAAVYLFIAIALLIRTLLGWVQCWRLVSAATKASLPPEHQCSYPVFASDRVVVPATVGIVKPKILLPSDWSEWSAADVSMAIAHESSHIRRRDTLTTLLTSLNCALYWFHPLSWILKSRLAELAEHACDDAVISQDASRGDYAQCLLRMASRLSGRSKNVSFGVGMARTSLVEQRVDQIMNLDRKPANRRGHVASILTMALVAIAASFTAAVGGFSVSEKTDGDKAVPERSITGVVLNPDGSPAVDADVFMSTWVPPSHRTQTKTDGKGRFIFTEFPDGVHRIVAKLGNLSSRQRWGGEVVEVGVSNLEIKLGATSTLQVTVLDSNSGKPIPNAVVEISRWFKEWQQTANDSGVATYLKLPREKWQVTAKAKGFALKSQELVVNEANTAVSISLSDPGADLFGTVTTEDGKPAQGAVVFVSPAEDSYLARGFSEQVRANEKGNYRFASLPNNKKLKIRVSRDGFLEQRTSVVLGVDPAGEQRMDFTVRPIPKRTIKGVVVDSKGSPIANATVSSRDLRRGPKCNTDESGNYELVGQLDGHSVLFQAKGYVSQVHEVAAESNEASIDVELKMGRKVSGRVVNEQGQPLSGVVVEGNSRVGPGWVSLPSNLCVSDGDGRFEIDSLTSDAKLRFSKTGYGSIGDVSIPESGDELIEPIQLSVEGLIRGVVVDSKTSRPVDIFRAYYTWSKARLASDPPKGTMSMASHRGDLFSSSDGSFEFDGFRNGVPLQVTIEAEGYRKCVVNRVVATGVDGNPTTFKMEPIDSEESFTVSGQIVDPAKKGISGVKVRLICSDERAQRAPTKDAHVRGRNDFPYNWEMIFSNQIAEDSRVLQLLEATTDGDGKFSFANVHSANDIEIAYWNDNVVRARTSGIEGLSLADQQSVTIVATQSGIIRGSIDLKANPYAGPMIRIGDVSYYAEILDDGKTFEIRGVPAGKHDVLISGDPKPLKIPGQKDDGAFTTSVIKRITVSVRAGKVSRADATGDPE